MKTRKAILLAAGMSTRLRPLTDDRPKPMLSLGDAPLLEYNVRRLARHGIAEIAINLHHCPQIVRDHFGDGSRFGVQIAYFDEPALLGTAGALKAMEPFIADERVLVHYGDNLTTCGLDDLETLHESCGGVATIALFSKADVSPHSAVEFGADARITRFVEKPKPHETTSRWISAGVQLVEPWILDYIPANQRYDFGFDLYPRLLASGERMYAYCMGQAEGLWWIDTPADYANACRLAAAGTFV